MRIIFLPITLGRLRKHRRERRNGSEEIWRSISELAKRDWARPSIQINDRFGGCDLQQILEQIVQHGGKEAIPPGNHSG
jgi:hypothetical protein